MITLPDALAPLMALPQWVCWMLRDGKKIPINAKVAHLPHSQVETKGASTNNPATWCDFEKAQWTAHVQDWIQGVGFMFSPDDPLCCIDVDLYKVDGFPDRQQFIDQLRADLPRTFTEWSQSGKGLHLLGWCNPAIKNDVQSMTGLSDCVDVFTHHGFVAITGNTGDIGDMPLADLTNTISRLGSFRPRAVQVATPVHPSTANASAQEIVDKINGWRNENVKTKALALLSPVYDPATVIPYGKYSAAESRLAEIVALYTTDANTFLQVIRATGLYRGNDLHRDPFGKRGDHPKRTTPEKYEDYLIGIFAKRIEQFTARKFKMQFTPCRAQLGDNATADQWVDVLTKNFPHKMKADPIESAREAMRQAAGLRIIGFTGGSVVWDPENKELRT